ncbi:MAG: hypothetical protein ACI4XG_00730, partial [Bradyrhizobium sp.]
MPTYDDLFIRSALDDAGTVPDAAATVCKSPDIIVWGDQPLPDPDAFLVQNYGTTWYRNVAAGVPNYIYCRATNLFNAAQTGALYLYYAPGGVLSDISTWRNNRIPTAIPGQDYLKLDAREPGAVVVGDTAFKWTPDQAGQYCLIAQITTAEHPDPLPPSFGSTDDYVRWLIGNPAVAWRNVTVVGGGWPIQYVQDFTFQNLDGPRIYAFMISATGLPEMSRVIMASATPGPKPPIYVEGQVTQPPNFSLTCISSLPAKFSTALRVDVLLSTGLPQSANVELTLDAFVAVEAQDTGYLRSFARPA